LSPTVFAIGEVKIGGMRHRLLLPLLFVLPMGVRAEDPPVRPVIRVGEVLTYRVNSSRFGDIGTAVMRVDEDTAQGQLVYRLSFAFKGRVLLFTVSDETRSWVDMATLSSVRYSKRERTPIGNRDEAVEMNPAAGVWSDARGEHPLANHAPMDELAFIYFVRGLPMTFDEMNIARHFDAERNPVVFRRIGQELVSAPGGDRPAAVIEMRVPDERQKGGFSTLRFYISDDDERLPLRIDSSMPMAGTMKLTLESVTVGQ